jgi:glycosyltransferase involved in cell wall biosynthesis
MYIAPRENVRVLPSQPPDTYRDAYAAAEVLCQPSQREAFSIVLMEGWLAGAAALVHASCEVTRAHVAACNGGLWFGNSAEFGASLDWLLSHPRERAMMGEAGRQYVRDHYSWGAVLPRVEAALSW